MVLNKTTLNSETGKLLVDIIKTLISVVDHSVFDDIPKLKADVNKVLDKCNEDNTEYTIL